MNFDSVLLTIETPALLGRKYQLNPQQTGLCFVAYLLGALLGEVSDIETMLPQG